MTKGQPPSSLPSVRAAAVIVVLATAIGTILGGLRGMQAGWVAGLVLSLAPYLSAYLWSRLTRPDGIARLLVRETAAGFVRVASGAGAAISKAVVPPAAAIASTLQLPILVVGFLAAALAAVTADLLAKLLRRIATPLGMANIGAIVIIVADVAGSEAASFACFIGLVVLILVLMVSEFERVSASS